MSVPHFTRVAKAYDLGKPPLVTVIIPVYNVEEYLEECMDSAISQTLKEIEIICVNDGSTDGSLAILEKYQEKDSRITVISKENEGQSIARNCALDYARGDYIQFLDSDDLLQFDALEILYSLCEEKKLDAVFFDFERFVDGDVEDFYLSGQGCRKGYSEIYEGVSLIKKMKDNHDYLSSPCIIMLKASFLRQYNISFYEHIIHEDELFTFQVFMYARRVSHIGKALYKRRIRPKSTMTSPKSYKNVVGYFFVMIEIMKYGLSVESDEQRRHESWRAFQSLSLVARDIYSKLSKKEREKVNFENPFMQLLFASQISQMTKDNSCMPLLDIEIDGELLKNEYKKQYAYILKLRNELSAIENSFAYKLSRFFTFIPRKIYGGVKCFSEHGFSYTLQRLLEHFGIKI